MSQIASDSRFAIRITNHNCSQIARFGALREGGCNKTLFLNLRFATCEKSSFFWPVLGQNLVDVQKTLYKSVFQHIFKSKHKQKMTILKGYLRGLVKAISGAKFGAT